MRNVPETIHAYKIPRLNWIFVVLSLLFVASMVWMVWFDYIGYRKWKDYQREFQQIEAAKLRKDLQDAEVKAEEAGLTDINQKIQDQQRLVDENRAKLEAVQKKADELRVVFENKDTDFKFRKADLDAQKYLHDVAFHKLQEHPDDAEAKRHYLDEKGRLDAMKAEVDDLERQAQDLERQYKEALAGVEKITGERDALEKERKLLLTKKVLIEKRLQTLTNPVIQNVVNAPFLEITEPTIRVKQIVLDNHRFNVNFAEVERVDRCISCHNGIAKRDPGDGNGVTPKKELTQEQLAAGDFHFAELPQPHTAHPKLDVFVGDGSAHPMDKFGCTPCHWGWDRGMDFNRTAHTPDPGKVIRTSLTTNGKTEVREKTQEEDWVEKYHWHEWHYAEQKMRPSSFIESSCLKCHTGQTSIPHAEKLTHGIRLIEQAGCFNCHKMRQLETFVKHPVKEGEDLHAIARLYDSDPELIREASDLKTDEVKAGLEVSVPVRALTRTGPSLLKVSSKLDKDWMRGWLADPKRFRPNTFMPQFWHLENTYQRLTNITERLTYRGVSGKEIEMAERDEVEIDAITEFVFALSDAPKHPAPPVQGDAGNGKKLVENLGCFACHVVNERLEQDLRYSDGTPVDDLKFPLLKLTSKIASLDEQQYARSRSQGPMLFGSGSKMDVNWLYAWLKDPKQYHPRTKMPDLRLSDQEAADIAAFLVTLKNDEFDKRVAGDQERWARNVDRHELVRNDTVQEYLEGEFSKADAEELIKNYATDSKRKEQFDGKIVDVLRRVKYSDVCALHGRWSSLVSWVQGLAADAGDPERRAGKSWLERLAKDTRETALRRPTASALLTGWADQMTAFAAIVARWNSLEDTDRKNALAQAQEATKAAHDALCELARKESNAFDFETKKRVYLGEKLVGRYGCYSCHAMQGYGSVKPIGVELSTWGTKLTGQLDFGYLEGKVGHNNYAYVQQKVKAPRSFDKTDVKKPQEWLKMPQFNFTEDQIKAISVAIMGMTDENVLPQARKQLSEAEWQIENGRWMVKELNCVGCHVVENEGGAILATLDPNQKQLWPPNLAGTGTKLKPNWLYHFLKEPGVHQYRYWLNVRMPTFGFSDEQINTFTRYFALLDKQSFPFEQGVLQAKYNPPKDMLEAGEKIYETFQCYKCHNVRPAEQAGRASNIGPNMAQVKERMRPRGIVTWLRDPSVITPGVNMPANWPIEADAPNPLPKVLDGDTEKQIQAVADYLLTYDGSIESKYPVPKEEPQPAGGTTEYE